MERDALIKALLDQDSDGAVFFRVNKKIYPVQFVRSANRREEEDIPGPDNHTSSAFVGMDIVLEYKDRSNER